MPYVVPLAAVRRVFDSTGRIQDDAVEQQLRTLGSEVVRVAERFTAAPSVHRADECDEAAGRVAALAGSTVERYLQ